ncbi:DinB family protein [Cochleicola gelatinilyticus]|uniref:Damage-inducible protein DinB n=1 Tax=Cochleicola gelatinilyticus TaxID=1763537 RepID=A0A167H111_9FLAO|nr:DinB family protein [Cochleicola gelatinilyticus]OAB78100.1 damage-inducible protein DinB [Cochleicola gelatinilyticus]
MTSQEYNPYYKTYINLVTEPLLTKSLSIGLLNITDFFNAIPNDKLEYRYATNKWTPKEVLLHLIDTERVFSYRALTFARSKNVELPGFDQDEFVQNSDANKYTLDELLDDYLATRTATISLFKGFNEKTLQQSGIASGSTLSVRAAGTIICGHEIHHCNIIKERYL